MNKPEYIVCAAIWYRDFDRKRPISNQPNGIFEGVVVGGLNHAQCISIFNGLTGIRTPEAGLSIQGFITSKNRFVDRSVAMRIARSNGQQPPVNTLEEQRKELYSEDLY